jgi:signal peptidase II
MRRFYFAAAGVVIADQLTKWLVGASLAPNAFLSIIDGIGLTSLRNTGASFGMLQGQNAVLIVVSVIVGALILWRKKLAPWKGGPVLCGLILGGLLGNLIDRVYFGSVLDFIQVGWWPAFNIADSALTLGVIGLVYESWRMDTRKKK